jgi:hypothetical protein
MLPSDPTSWWQAFDGLIFSAIGALLGGTVVAWLGGYYSENGKRELITEELPKILDQARKMAYQEQQGKNLATKEDVQQVVDQVRAVTRETEAIKAEISGELWHKQALRNDKRDAYARVVSACRELEQRGVAVIVACNFVKDKKSDPTKLYRAIHEYYEMHQALKFAISAAELFVVPEGRIVLNELGVGYADPGPDAMDVRAHEKNQQTLRAATADFLEFARKDLQTK